MTRLIGPLILAAGILGATIVSMLAAESAWWVLAGPLIMALATVVAVLAERRVHGPSRGAMAAALIFGAAMVLAGVILAVKNPLGVAVAMPILGGGAVVVLANSWRRRDGGAAGKARG